MKKYIAGAAMLFGIAAFFQVISCNTSSDKKPAAAKADSMQSVLDRGKYLAEHVAACVDCHSQRDFSKFSGPVITGTEFAGGMVFDQKYGLPGVIYGKNITPDNETGIGTWTDEEILRAITQGISKKGDTLFPLMPYTSYNRLAKDDLMAIIAYLRTLKPVKNRVPDRQLMIPIAAAYPAPALQPSVDNNQRPPASDPVAYGRYLVTASDCITCHSPQTPQGPDPARLFAGGFSFQLPSNKVVSANITSDSATGIGTWTEERFLGKFTQYREEKNYLFDPGKQNTIMPVTIYAGMKDEDLRAMFAYIRTIPPVRNQVEKFPK